MSKPWTFGLFLAAGLIGAVAFFGLFLSGADRDFSFKRDVFDSAQYLFAGENKVSGAIDLGITNGAFLAAAAPPFLVKGTVLGALGSIEVEVKEEIQEYVVEEGDTLLSIGQKFGISTQTILWSNPSLSSKSVLKPGQKIVILPTDGMIHMVSEGDTLSEIAQLYSVKQADIADFNDLADAGKIYAGDLLIVPGAAKPKYPSVYVKVPLSSSYFICPIPAPCYITQGLHFYNAIDFSNGVCGQPVYAAASGIVQKTGYTSQGGRYVRIQHPNGVITYYGHLSRVAVNAGSRVYQGRIIGYVGYTGHTIPSGPAGCHVHFDVRFAANPFAKFKVGTALGN